MQWAQAAGYKGLSCMNARLRYLSKSEGWLFPQHSRRHGMAWHRETSIFSQFAHANAWIAPMWSTRPGTVGTMHAPRGQKMGDLLPRMEHPPRLHLAQL